MLNRICYIVGIACIVLAVLICIAMIWLPVVSDLYPKALATLAVVFGGALLTRTISGGWK